MIFCASLLWYNTFFFFFLHITLSSILVNRDIQPQRYCEVCFDFEPFASVPSSAELGPSGTGFGHKHERLSIHPFFSLSARQQISLFSSLSNDSFEVQMLNQKQTSVHWVRMGILANHSTRLLQTNSGEFMSETFHTIRWVRNTPFPTLQPVHREQRTWVCSVVFDVGWLLVLRQSSRSQWNSVWSGPRSCWNNLLKFRAVSASSQRAKELIRPLICCIRSMVSMVSSEYSGGFLKEV